MWGIVNKTADVLSLIGILTQREIKKMKWKCKNCENAFQSAAAAPVCPKCNSDDVKVDWG